MSAVDGVVLGGVVSAVDGVVLGGGVVAAADGVVLGGGVVAMVALDCGWLCGGVDVDVPVEGGSDARLVAVRSCHAAWFGQFFSSKPWDRSELALSTR